MSTDRTTTYRAHLDTYHTMIRLPLWWDGRRDALVAEMNAEWNKLSNDERVAVLFYSESLYARSIDVPLQEIPTLLAGETSSP